MGFILRLASALFRAYLGFTEVLFGVCLGFTSDVFGAYHLGQALNPKPLWNPVAGTRAVGKEPLKQKNPMDLGFISGLGRWVYGGGAGRPSLSLNQKFGAYG